jgi:hypothetical protein
MFSLIFCLFCLLGATFGGASLQGMAQARTGTVCIPFGGENIPANWVATSAFTSGQCGDGDYNTMTIMSLEGLTKATMVALFKVPTGWIITNMWSNPIPTGGIISLKGLKNSAGCFEDLKSIPSDWIATSFQISPSCLNDKGEFFYHANIKKMSPLSTGTTFAACVDYNSLQLPKGWLVTSVLSDYSNCRPESTMAQPSINPDFINYMHVKITKFL